MDDIIQVNPPKENFFRRGRIDGGGKDFSNGNYKNCIEIA